MGQCSCSDPEVRLLFSIPCVCVLAKEFMEVRNVIQLFVFGARRTRLLLPFARLNAITLSLVGYFLRVPHALCWYLCAILHSSFHHGPATFLSSLKLEEWRMCGVDNMLGNNICGLVNDYILYGRVRKLRQLFEFLPVCSLFSKLCWACWNSRVERQVEYYRKMITAIWNGSNTPFK